MKKTKEKMKLKLFDKAKESLGLSFKPGDKHYRAYVGPPQDYDLVSAMVFNLLTCVGLRQHHRVLDVGCGSLRCGRLLIPYLNRNNYIGVEPNKWLVEDGIQKEIGSDLVRIKQPRFSYNTNLSEFKSNLNIDYAFAQSIFSHTGADMLADWLREIYPHLNEQGMLLATFIEGDIDTDEQGWIYPGCVKFTESTLREIGTSEGYDTTRLDFSHPRQTWVAFTKKGTNKNPFLRPSGLDWNNTFRLTQEINN